MEGTETFFIDRQDIDDGIVVVTEIMRMPDGSLCQVHLRVGHLNGKGWCKRQMNRALRSMESQHGLNSPDDLPPDPGGWGSSDGDDSPPPASPAIVYPDGSLWVEPVSVASNLFNAVLHGAISGSNYLIISTGELKPPTNSTWQVEGSLQGSTNDPTPFTLGIATRTNNLFIRAQVCDPSCASTALPLAWQLNYFGVTGVDPSSDLDGDNVNNLQEYQGGTDPNKIVFRTSLANDHVNTDSVSVSIEVDGGIPVQMAVLVNSTNFATTNWIAYSPTYSAALPTTDGKYEVWVGLRGFATDSQQTWNLSVVTRDTHPPTVVIISPAPGITSYPIIQVQGYSPEPLASLSCDLSNALGLATNQTALLLDQHYDTTTGEFTTNYFQVFDLQLTNGLNSITLHATDLAGNETVTNFNYTLDYTGKTNPVVQIAWPQDGMAVSGSEFTLYGFVDDPTVTVLAFTTDTDGNTNMLAGEVERTGRFWVDDLPLNAGSTPVSMLISNAVGLASVTNLNVIQSTIGLAMDAVADDSQLWQPTVGLVGTISDPNATVTVNGKTAVNNGDGTWGASDVPTTAGGVAIFQMSASVPGSPTANALSGPNKPARVYVAEDHLYNNSYGYDANVVYYDAPCHVSHQWLAYHYDVYDAATHPGVISDGGATMEYRAINGYFASDDFQFSYPDIGQAGTSIWLNPPDPIYQDLTTNTLPARPTYWRHVAEGWELRAASFFIGNGMWPGTATQFNIMGADTVVHLQTGGRNGSTRQNLFCLSGSATARTNSIVPFFEPLPDPDQMPGAPDKPVPPEQIEMAGGALGNDGNRWVLLPDGQDLPITPRVKGNQFYTFTATAQKYTLHIVANGTPLAQDHVAPQAYYCVGQYLAFSPMWRPGVPPGISSQVVQWQLGGSYVNDSWQLCTNNPEFPVPIYYGSVNYSNNPAMLTNENTHAWWVSGGFESPDEYTASLTEKLSFSNGQAATLSRKGLFDMSRPKILGFTPSTSTCVVLDANDPSKIYLGVGGKEEWEGGNMQWRLNFKVPGAEVFLGNVAYTQLVQGDFDYNVSYLGGTIWLSESTDGEYWLDNREEYLTKPIINSSRTLQWFDFMDGPSLSAPFLSWVDEMDQFKTYMRYKPCTTGAIYITLGRVDWGWHGRAEGTPWSLTVSNIFGPVLDASDQAFPRWEETYYNAGSGH